MMELVDVPGMSAKFRIYRMRTANFKTVEGTLDGNFCAPKLGVPKILVGDDFCMRGAPVRKKRTHGGATLRCRNLLLSPNNFTCGQLIKWLVTNVTAIRSPGRAKSAILLVILAGCVFGQSRTFLWPGSNFTI